MKPQNPTSDFTNFVRELGASAEVDPGRLERLLEVLGKALMSELRRRGLSSHPPVYLGLIGHSRWNDRMPAAGSASALRELTVDCYEHVFITRLDSLRSQLRVKPNIDGLVFLAIRGFVTDRQRKQDPLGYRVFDVVRAALRRAIDTEVVEIASGNPGLRNETLLSFRHGRARGSASLDRVLDAAAWADELLPDFFAATGPGSKQALDRRIDGLLAKLGNAGCGQFRMKELLDPLKHELRARWAAECAIELEQLLPSDRARQPGTSLLPDLALEISESFSQVTQGVEVRISALAREGLDTTHLSELWRLLVRNAATGESRMPPQRQLASQFGVSRRRVRELIALLRTLVQDALEVQSTAASVR